MAAFSLAPLIGLATGLPGSGVDIVDEVSYRGLGLAVPYAMGRIYFAGGDGPRMVAIALIIAGLSYIPVCLYEEAVGPSRYLSTLIYRTPIDEITTDRLGGWRPVGFLNDGLAVAAWMAMTAVMATWLWLGRLAASEVSRLGPGAGVARSHPSPAGGSTATFSWRSGSPRPS